VIHCRRSISLCSASVYRAVRSTSSGNLRLLRRLCVRVVQGVDASKSQGSPIAVARSPSPTAVTTSPGHGAGAGVRLGGVDPAPGPTMSPAASHFLLKPADVDVLAGVLRPKRLSFECEAPGVHAVSVEYSSVVKRAVV
jgi:hypothetical protein